MTTGVVVFAYAQYTPWSPLKQAGSSLFVGLLVLSPLHISRQQASIDNTVSFGPFVLSSLHIYMSLGTRRWFDRTAVFGPFVLSPATCSLYIYVSNRRWIAELYAFLGLLLLVLPPHGRSLDVAGV